VVPFCYTPFPGIEIEPVNSSYQIFYNDYTILKFPPEAYYYERMSNVDFLENVTIFDMYMNFNDQNLFNPTEQQDIWLNVTGIDNLFFNQNSKFFQRYTMLNFGLGGFFTPLTPR
jgi:hypothetical protein